MNITTTLNNIKIEYSTQGYLDDIPYHLISDKEMFDAFLSDSEECYFRVNYPQPDDTASEEVKEAYASLVHNISHHIQCYLEDVSRTYQVPDWIYSYMLGYCIGPMSKECDILYLQSLISPSQRPSGSFSNTTFESILDISSSWVSKLRQSEREYRPPTIFGEPHVVKSLRLRNEV